MSELTRKQVKQIFIKLIQQCKIPCPTTLHISKTLNHLGSVSMTYNTSKGTFKANMRLKDKTLDFSEATLYFIIGHEIAHIQDNLKHYHINNSFVKANQETEYQCDEFAKNLLIANGFTKNHAAKAIISSLMDNDDVHHITNWISHTNRSHPATVDRLERILREETDKRKIS